MNALVPETNAAPAFETICDLGRGGMGTVRLVRVLGPQDFGRLFVLKRLRDDRKDEESALRFAYEGRVASAIHHANVVQTHHVGQDGEGMFLVLDYVEGASLEQLLAAAVRNGKLLPHPLALRVALDTLAGLSAVHDARDLAGEPLGVLHRDVTLQNILIGVDGVSRLADFGIAKAKISPVVTNQAYVLGKLRFLAPEYVRREGVTQSIDVYSLGVSLWHALTGRVLWREANEAELIEHVTLDSVPPVSSHVSVAPALDAIVGKACARDPRQRYQTAREMAQALEASGVAIATHSEVGELVQRLFAGELRERRRLIAEMTSRSRPYQPKVYSQNVRAGSRRQASAGSRRAWLLGGAALLAGVGLLAAHIVRADAKAAAVAARPLQVATAAVTPERSASPTPPPAASLAEGVQPAQPEPARDPQAPTAKPRRPAAAGPLIKKNPYRE